MNVGQPPAMPPPSLCKLCEDRKPPARTNMIARSGGRAPICPRCDRRRCNRVRIPSDPTSVCGTVLLEGNEVSCPTCGADVRLQTATP